MKKATTLLLFALIGLFSCKDDDEDPIPIDQGVDLKGIAYSPTAYTIVSPPGFPAMEIPSYNPTTVEGIKLGRHLFYDPILSLDSTVSCSSCHKQEFAFTDPSALSTGVGGLLGKRSSMSLANVGFFTKGFFWDGRSPSLEEQSLHPVVDPREMAEDWTHVEAKLRNHDQYRQMFRKAFGIENSLEITKELAARALAQFERTMISSNSKFDKKILQGDPDPFLFTDLEADGKELYFDADGASENAGHCAHCHDGKGLLSSERYENNAITQVLSLEDFPDKGLGAITGVLTDNGKFKAPSLRNIELTAPYMHNGSIATLEEVIEHYNSGGHYADNVILGSVTQLHLTAYQKSALLAFLKTFTDTSFIHNEALKSPFE